MTRLRDVQGPFSVPQESLSDSYHIREALEQLGILAMKVKYKSEEETKIWEVIKMLKEMRGDVRA